MKTTQVIKFVVIALMVVTISIKMFSREAGSRAGQQHKMTDIAKGYTERLQLSLIAEDREVVSGSKIQLKLFFRNLTKSSVIVGVTFPERDYEITVKDESGRTLPIKPEGSHLLYSGGSREQVEFKPGESLRDEIELTKLYDMKRPGMYAISASRVVFLTNKRMRKVVSDRLLLKVVK